MVGAGVRRVLVGGRWCAMSSECCAGLVGRSSMWPKSLLNVPIHVARVGPPARRSALAWVRDACAADFLHRGWVAAFVALVVALPVVVTGLASAGGWIGVAGIVVVLVATVAVMTRIDLGSGRTPHHE